MGEEFDDREGGFIVLHRRVRSWPLWQTMTAEHKVVWVELILAANWKSSVVWTRAGRLVVQRGQALITQRGLADLAGVSRKNVRTALELLTHEGAIQVAQVPTRTSRHASLITVVNYEKYQKVPERDAPPPSRRGPKSGPIKPRGTVFPPDPEISSPVSPSVERGDDCVVVDHEEWRRRREAQLEKLYGGNA